MKELKQIGYVGKNVQGNHIYDSEGLSATIASQTGGLGGSGGGVYLVYENDPRFLIDDQGRSNKKLKPLDICPTLRREMHGNEPRVVEPIPFHGSMVNENKEAVNINNSKPRIKGNFKYVSLFSGIGGFESALNKLGGTCVLASEIDKFANQAYEVLYGEPTAGDITKIDAKDVPDHDLLVGGFPCQAFSVAGKRGGFDDARGTLFFEVARLAKEKQPKMLLLENVKGLVGHNSGKTLDTIAKVLNEIGYTIDFEVLNSKFFGVPQNRERIFIVAVRDDLITQEAWKIEGTNVVAKGKCRISQYEGVKTFNFDWPSQKSVTTKLRDILESEVDERYYLSEEKTAKLISQLEEKEQGRKDSDNCEMVGLGHREPKVAVEQPSVKSLGNVNPSGNANKGEGAKIAVEFSRKTGVGKELEVAHTVNHSDWRGLNRNQTKNAVMEEVRPCLTPDRVEKRQNGRRFKDNDEEMFTLTAQDKHGVAIVQTGRGFNKGGEHDVAPTLTSNAYEQNNFVKSKYRIRKLTPKECWRLQGFTDEQHDKVELAGISNSQRYKMAGNAVTVNVIEAIGERLVPYLK